jgi:hypothetical protein
MQQTLASEFDLGRYARAAEMSEAHFSRQFKRSFSSRAATATIAIAAFVTW